MQQFVDAYSNALRRYAHFSGRTSVGGFWRFVAANLVVSVVLLILTSVSSTLVLLDLLYGLAMLIPGIAIAVRRLHDTGRSAWYLLVAFIPLIGAIVLIVLYVQASDGPNRYGIGPED
jgi:uncharacterized membrane protein YhaH (DUF805 family)